MAKSAKNCIPDEVDVHRKLVKVTHYHQDGQCWLVLVQGFWIGVWMNHSHPNVQVGTLILGVLIGDLHRLETVNHLYMKDKFRNLHFGQIILKMWLLWTNNTVCF